MDVADIYQLICDELTRKGFNLSSGGGAASDEPEQLVYEDALNELSALEESLNAVKVRIGAVAERFGLQKWHSHTRFSHPTKPLPKILSERYELPLCTQAYCKFAELLVRYPRLTAAADREETFRTLHLCEAPGAFITALGDILGEVRRASKWQWKVNSLNPYHEWNEPTDMLVDDRLISANFEKTLFGDDDSGDVTKWSKDYIATTVNVNGKFHLVTADGSFNCQEDDVPQESLVADLIKQEVRIALQALESGGSLVLKLYTFFRPETLRILLMLLASFEQVVLCKPSCSKAGNSEVYAVAMGFTGTVEPSSSTSATYMRIVAAAKLIATYQKQMMEFNLATFPFVSEAQRASINIQKMMCLERLQLSVFGFLNHRKDAAVKVADGRPWSTHAWTTFCNRIEAEPMDPRQSTIRIEIAAEDRKALASLGISVVTASDCNSTRPIRNSLFVDKALLDSATCMNLNTCDLCQTPILGAASNPKKQWIALLQSLCGLSELPGSVRLHDDATIEVLLPADALVLSRFSASTLAVLSLAYEQLDLTDEGISLRRQRLLPANILEGLRNLVDLTEVLQFVPLELLAWNTFYFPVLNFNNGRLRTAMGM